MECETTNRKDTKVINAGSFIGFGVMFLLYCIFPARSFADPEVQIWAEPLTVLTYIVAPADPNPRFYAGRGYQGAQGRIYPYPISDVLTNQREDKTYNAVYLENQYLKICVLPEIGGRIFSAMDKTNNYDFFYRQHVIKPALIGMLGAWVSGGVEWNFPHHHRARSFMPMDYEIIDSRNGGKTLWMSEVDNRHRMRFLLGMTLYPDKSYVEVTVTISNQTPLTHSFLYWANPSVHVDETYQVIFPPKTQFVTQHGKNEFSEWPVSNSRYGGWKYNNVDISWWKNLPKPVSFFCWNEADDFFAGYNHGKNAGVAYVADHHIAPGKKFFTFGCGDEGKMWDKMLTDSDGPYLELMAGAYTDNQPDYSWIQPYEVKTVKQYWYPIRDIEGLKYANINAALNLELISDTKAKIRINTTSVLEDAQITLRSGSQIIYDTKTVIRPDLPFKADVNLPAGIQKEDLVLALYSGGKLIAQYQMTSLEESQPRPQPVVPPMAPQKIKTIEELYLAGLRLNQFYNTKLDPYSYYNEALLRDPSDSRVNTQLGILYCKRGLYSKAQQYLDAAIGRIAQNYTMPKTAEAYYYLGLALRGQGKYQLAYDAFSRASWDLAWHSASYYSMAELDCRSGNYEIAREHLQQAIATNSWNIKILNLHTTVLRKLNNYTSARENTLKTLDLDPLDFRAKNELYLIESGQNRKDSANKELENLKQLMADDVQSCIELAVDYGNCGLYNEAIDVLARLNNVSKYPMLYYYLGYYSQLDGSSQQAHDYFSIAAKMPSEYCFPFRLESIDVLTAAIADNPKDNRAHYYLGNFWYDNKPELAINHWQSACRLDETNPTAYRNLGFAYWQVRNDIPNAIASMEKAISIDSNDPRLFYELDMLYEAARVPAKTRLAWIEKNAATVSKRDDALARKALLYVQTENYEKAFNLLTTHHFNTWEGSDQIHDIYVDACLLYGRQQYLANELPKALDLYQAALKYPDNLEIGRPLNDESAVKALCLLGGLYETLNQPQEAQECYKKAISIEVEPDESMYYQALALMKSDDMKKAQGLFVQLIDESSRLLARDKGEDFFAKFGEKQSQDKKTANAHYLKGLGCQGQNKIELARKEFEKVIELDIDHVWARICLDELNHLIQAGPLRNPQVIRRSTPTTLPEHPGNIFLDDEEVNITVPADLSQAAANWKVVDDVGNRVAVGVIDECSPVIKVGNPGIGWYKVEFLDPNQKVVDYTTAAVLARLTHPIPQDSPVSVDAAISILVKDAPRVQEQIANIATLAGINWIRDRIVWRDIQPDKDTFVENTRYHIAADIQSRNGLKILQSYSITPKWAVAKDQKSNQFPQDLLTVYNSCRQFGKMFAGQVGAWEPWNEANASNFGGHTMAQMCSYQKAAYLGYKAGNSDIIVGWNPYGGDSTEHHTNGILYNETWPYFDTYNIHSYAWPDSYLDIFAPAQKAACGKPIWLTECDRGMQSMGNSPWYELSPENSLLKAQFMAQSYAASLSCGIDRHFHFILVHYTEGQDVQHKIQFGLLRKDLTPRPSYVALAAVGRFLAGAKPLGKYNLPDQPNCRIYAFSAKPDGKDRDVVVAWAEISGDWPTRGKFSTSWPLSNLKTEEIFDYLGRSLGNTVSGNLNSAPVFIILPAGEAKKLALDKPQQSEYRCEKASPVVLQIVMPESIKMVNKKETPWIFEPQYTIAPGKETPFNFYAYNFSTEPLEGQIKLTNIPKGWKCTPDQWKMRLEPMERKPFTATLFASDITLQPDNSNWIKLQGEFSNSNRAVLAFYLTANPQNSKP